MKTTLLSDLKNTRAIELAHIKRVEQMSSKIECLRQAEGNEKEIESIEKAIDHSYFLFDKETTSFEAYYKVCYYETLYDHIESGKIN